jgi:hypothetical protein
MASNLSLCWCNSGWIRWCYNVNRTRSECIFFRSCVDSPFSQASQNRLSHSRSHLHTPKGINFYIDVSVSKVYDDPSHSRLDSDSVVCRKNHLNWENRTFAFQGRLQSSLSSDRLLRPPAFLLSPPASQAIITVENTKAGSWRLTVYQRIFIFE